MAARGEYAERVRQLEEVRERNARRIERRPQIVFENLTRQRSTFTRTEIAREVFRCIDDGERFQKLMARLEGSPELVVVRPNLIRDGEVIEPARYTTRRRYALVRRHDWDRADQCQGSECTQSAKVGEPMGCGQWLKLRNGRFAVSTPGVLFSNSSVSAFGTGIQLGNNGYVDDFDGVNWLGNGTAISCPAGLSNAGENIRIRGGGIDKTAPQLACEFVVDDLSMDDNSVEFNNQGGSGLFTAVHFENSTGCASPLFATDGCNSLPTPRSRTPRCLMRPGDR